MYYIYVRVATLQSAQNAPSGRSSSTIVVGRVRRGSFRAIGGTWYDALRITSFVAIPIDGTKKCPIDKPADVYVPLLVFLREWAIYFSWFRFRVVEEAGANIFSKLAFSESRFLFDNVTESEAHCRTFSPLQVILTMRENEDVWFRSQTNQMRAMAIPIVRLMSLLSPSYRRMEAYGKRVGELHDYPVLFGENE